MIVIFSIATILIVGSIVGLITIRIIFFSKHPLPKALEVITVQNSISMKEVAKYNNLWFLPVTHIAFQPNSDRLASVSGVDTYHIFFIISGYRDTIQLWDVGNGKVLNTLKGDSTIDSIAFSPSGYTLASAEEYEIALWDTLNGDLFQTIDTHRVTDISFFPDGKTLVSGSGWDDTVSLWQVNDGSLIKTLDEFNILVFSPNGQIFATYQPSDESIQFWNTDDGNLVGSNEDTPLFPREPTFSPDGTALVFSGGGMHLWRVSDGALLQSFENNTSQTEFAFSPNGKIIASASYSENTISIWDVSNGNLLKTLEGNSEGISQLAFSPNGVLLASASLDGTIRLWGVTP